MPNNATFMADLIDPEVMAGMISAKVEERVMALPYVAIDTTLEGRPGTTITVPRYTYSFGTAVEVPEGEEIPTKALATDSVEYTIKKVGNGGKITDEAVLSGYGDPVGQTSLQLAQSMTNKFDQDSIDELYKVEVISNPGKALCYDSLVTAIDLFDEEENTPKVMFVNPKQVTHLRKDPDFLSADKYKSGVRISGEVGRICNTTIVPRKKVKLVTYEKDNSASGTGVVTITEANLAEYQAKVDPTVTLAKSDKVKPLASNAQYYVNPLIKIQVDGEIEETTPALTMFVKRQTQVETERISKRRMTEVTADKHYVVALTNESRVILVKHNATANAAG